MTNFLIRALGVTAVALLAPAAPAQYRAEYRAAVEPLPNAGLTAAAVAVNGNPGSGLYGFVYVAGHPADGPARVAICRPEPPLDATSALVYQDTGVSIEMPDPDSNPAALAVGRDDTVWLLDTARGRILSAPPFRVGGGALMAVPQVDLGGVPAAGLRVRGTAAEATIYVLEAGAQPAVAVYEVKGGAPSEPGVPTLLRRIPLAGGAAAGARAVAVDAGGFVFAPRNVETGGGTAFSIFNPDGADVTAQHLNGFRLPSYAPAVAGGAARFVADASVPGGGYILETFSTSAGLLGFRWDRAGGLLDAFGPPLAGAGPEYSVVSLSPAGTPDLDESGNLYALFDSGPSPLKVTRTPRFVTGDGQPTAAAVVDGVLYYGDSGGNLRAVDAESGAPKFRLPLAPGTSLLGRPAVQVVHGLTVIALVTGDGRVARVDVRDGVATPRWATAPLVPGAANAATTPAIVDDGEGRLALFAAMGNGADEARVFSLNPETGAVEDGSANLGMDIRSSPSVADGSLYIGVSGGANGAYRLSTTNLGTPLNAYAAGRSSSAPPFLMRADDGTQRAYLASDDGMLYAVNPATGNLDAGFSGGTVRVTESATLAGGPFVHDGRVYVGGSENTVYAAHALTGAGTDPTGGYVFFNANAGGTEGSIVGGLSVARLPTGGAAIVFGSSNGRVYEVRADNPVVYQVTLTDTSPGNGVLTAPTVAPDLASIFAANNNGRVFRVPIYPLPKFEIGQ